MGPGFPDRGLPKTHVQGIWTSLGAHLLQLGALFFRENSCERPLALDLQLFDCVSSGNDDTRSAG
jgi:hypothetical protein